MNGMGMMEITTERLVLKKPEHKDPPSHKLTHLPFMNLLIAMQS